MGAVTDVPDSRLRQWRWGCLLLLIVTILAVLTAIGWLMLREPPRPAGPLPTAVLWTATPTPIPTPTPTLTNPSHEPGEGRFTIGSRVQVSGTGGAGLSLRTGPGLDNERVDIADEGEAFIVAGGPVEADGLTWWLLKDEANPGREGWGAASYLLPEE